MASEIQTSQAMRDAKVEQINALNAKLDSKREELSGVFLPYGVPEQFDVMFLAEMPSMNVPKGHVPGDKIPNFDETARDKFLQEMMKKYGVAGSYATDMLRGETFLGNRPQKK
jgi:hypothetical protein